MLYWGKGSNLEQARFHAEWSLFLLLVANYGIRCRLLLEIVIILKILRGDYTNVIYKHFTRLFGPCNFFVDF